MGNASGTHKKVAEGGHSDGGLLVQHESMDIDNVLIEGEC